MLMSKGTETKEAEVMKNDAGTVGSATEEDIDAVVDAVMKKYDRESNTRVWEGKPNIFRSVTNDLSSPIVDGISACWFAMISVFLYGAGT